MPARRMSPMPKQVVGQSRGRYAQGGSQLRDFQGRFAGGGVSWVGIEASNNYILDLDRRTSAGAQAAANRLVESTVAWMKQNAPWQDRTGDARESLKGEVHFNPTGGEGTNVPALRIHLGHGVDYGVHLEFGMGGRYQIIRPGLERMARKLPESIIQEAGL